MIYPLYKSLTLKLLPMLVGLSLLLIPAIAIADDDEKEPLQPVYEQCPKTKRTQDCMTCHIAPWMHIDDGTPYAALKFPGNLQIINDILNNNNEVFYYTCEFIDPQEMIDVFQFMNRHNEISNRLVIEIHNPGGSAFDAWREINTIMSYWPKYEIETRLNGMAFSAGFLLFNAGELRRVAQSAELMWHEAAYMEMFSMVSASATKEKYDMMKHIQDNANSWLAGRSGGKTSKDWIDDKAGSLTGWWFNGKEAFERGFADELLK